MAEDKGAGSPRQWESCQGSPHLPPCQWWLCWHPKSPGWHFSSCDSGRTHLSSFVRYVYLFNQVIVCSVGLSFNVSSSGNFPAINLNFVLDYTVISICTFSLRASFPILITHLLVFLSVVSCFSFLIGISAIGSIMGWSPSLTFRRQCFLIPKFTLVRMITVSPST